MGDQEHRSEVTDDPTTPAWCVRVGPPDDWTVLDLREYIAVGWRADDKQDTAKAPTGTLRLSGPTFSYTVVTTADVAEVVVARWVACRPRDVVVSTPDVERP